MHRAIRRLLFPFWIVGHFLNHKKPDIIVFGILDPLLAFPLNILFRLFGVKTVASLTLSGTKDVIGLRDRGVGRNISYKIFLRSLSRLICISDALYDAAIEELGSEIPMKIHNGVMTDLFYDSISNEIRSDVRRSLGIPSDGFVFVFVGSLIARKGIDVLVEAFNKMSDEFPDSYMLLIGPKSRADNHNMCDDDVEKLLGKIIDKNRVVCTGKIGDPICMQRYLASSDVFVFPTRREGFPNAPVEAMACGLPTIVNRINGVTDIVPIHSETGFMVEGNCSDEFYKYMKYFAEDRDAVRLMGASARVRVEALFSFDRCVSRWESALVQLAYPR